MNSNNGSGQERIDITKDMVDYLSRCGEKMIARRKELLKSGAFSEKGESDKMKVLLDGVERKWNNIVGDFKKRNSEKLGDADFKKGNIRINGEDIEYHKKGVWRVKGEKESIAVKPLRDNNEIVMVLNSNLLLEVKNNCSLTVLHIDNMHV